MYIFFSFLSQNFQTLNEVIAFISDTVKCVNISRDACILLVVSNVNTTNISLNLENLPRIGDLEW